MIITRRLADGLVQYMYDNGSRYVLTDESFVCGSNRVKDVNNTTHVVVEDVMSPEYFVGGTQAYNTGVWSVVNQDKYDAGVAAQQLEIQVSMIEEGEKLTLRDNIRLSSGSPGILPDRAAHDSYMQGLYADIDTGVTTLRKPPYSERQGMTIALEDRKTFTFTRYEDQWGYRWYMTLWSSDVTNLALYIQDENGNYLYTTGALIELAPGVWYTECPAGQADATIEDVYFHWILGAGRISNDFKYAADEETLSGGVHYDERYD